MQDSEDEEGDASCATLPGEPASAIPLKAHSVAPQAASWPLRAAHEQTDLDYFQRVLRERESQRVTLLTRLAHERISVPLESGSYARIGALAKRCGAALLVKHILLAAATHLDGDPLDYLTKFASHSQMKETTYAQRSPSPLRPPHPTSGTRPYTADEAKQLVWHVL